MRIMTCCARAAVGGRRASILLAGAAIAMPTAALAQRAEDPELQDIVVTATKRGEQAIQDVPMSIAAIGSDRLKQMGADSFIGWSRSVPGLAVQDQGPGDKKYIIRGIQSVGAATTALYFDEIVMTGNNRQDGGGRQPDPKLYDMERIEVLRGPQGTLYGASSMSGTIRMITNKPKLDRFEGEVDGTVSGTRHGGASFRVNAMINLPVVSDRFAVRGVYYLRDEAGFIDNPLLGLKGINDDADVMKALVHRLLRMRVRPYYLYQMDLITGGAHFKVDVRKGIEIIKALRGHTTGYAIPQFVIDAPGGGGKVPLNPDYVLVRDEQRVVIRNYEGKTFEYPEPALVRR